MRRPYVMMVAPNGARRTKLDHPDLPITQSEIVDAVAQSKEAGAHAAHVHVRDATGSHVLDSELYTSLIRALHARCGQDFIVQITTQAIDLYTPQQQRALVDSVRPQAVSIALSELFVKPDDKITNRAFLHWARAQKIAVQWVLYTPEDVTRLASLIEEGVVPNGPNPMLFVLGRYDKNQQSDPRDIIPFLRNREEHSSLRNERWSVCAFGSAETACLTTALTLGGDVRVGFENSLWNPDGSQASCNAERVHDINYIANELGLPKATASQARSALSVAQSQQIKPRQAKRLWLV